MKNVLLIGGAGYVGTIMSSHLLKHDYNVTVLDNFIYHNQHAVQPYIGDPNYNFYYGELSDYKMLDKVSKDINHVIILGGLVGDPITKKYPNISGQINDVGVKKCIDFFDNKNIDKLIFISTCSNYGLIGENELADENFDLKPLSLYAEAKVSAEKHLLNKKGKVSYSGTILRFATAFGLSPRMRFDLSISEFVRDIYFGKELVVFDEHTWRPYCHVRDFARLAETVMTSSKDKIDFEVFNAGGDENNYTKKMIVDEILNNIPNGKVSYTEKGSDPRNYKVSFSKVKNELGFTPKFTVKNGIQELIHALDSNIYSDSLGNKEQYGNYTIND